MTFFGFLFPLKWLFPCLYCTRILIAVVTSRAGHNINRLIKTLGSFLLLLLLFAYNPLLTYKHYKTIYKKSETKRIFINQQKFHFHHNERFSRKTSHFHNTLPLALIVHVLIFDIPKEPPQVFFFKKLEADCLCAQSDEIPPLHRSLILWLRILLPKNIKMMRLR